MNNLVVKKRKTYSHSVIVLAIMWLLFSGLSHGQAATPKDAPVHIISDRLEAYQQQQKVIFIGNVVARRTHHPGGPDDHLLLGGEKPPAK